MTQHRDDPSDPGEGEAADHSRSGADVAAAVDRAAEGTPDQGVQTDPADMKPHQAPVEQVRGDEDMTGGQVVDGPGSAPDPA